MSNKDSASSVKKRGKRQNKKEVNQTIHMIWQKWGEMSVNNAFNKSTTYFPWSVLLLTTEMTSTCSKLKWNHEMQVSCFTAKSTNHGKLLSICFWDQYWQFLSPFLLKLLGISRAWKRAKQIVPPWHHSMVCNLIEHLALDQSEHDKSLRYGKIYFSLPRANVNESGMYICTLPIRQRSVIMTILECKTFFTFLLQRDFSQINGLSVAL